jgi:WD40 repeat protein
MMNCLSLALLLLLTSSPRDQPEGRDAAYTAKKEAEKASPKEVRRLIDQFGSDSFQEREAASKRLDAIGEAALLELRKAAADNPDPEVRYRANRAANDIARRCFTEVRCFTGHQRGLIQVALSGDGRLALSGGADHTARLWDVASGKELQKLVGHKAQVYAVAFRPGARQVLTGGEDNRLRLWDTGSGKEVRSFAGHGNNVTGVAFSPDGRIVLSSSWDLTLRLWDVESGKELRKLEGHVRARECRKKKERSKINQP